MPELVREHADELLVAAFGDLAVEADVADVDELLVLEARRGAGGLAQPRVERAEALGQRDLLALGERLVAEHQHGVVVHGDVDLGDARFVQLVQVDAARLRGEERMQRFEPERHVWKFEAINGKSKTRSPEPTWMT